MSGWLERLRSLLVPATESAKGPGGGSATDEKIALGVLLWSVAEADGRLLDAEKALIGQVLAGGDPSNPADVALVLASVEQAARERIDLYSFAHEAAEGLDATARAAIVRQLYRVACADGELDLAEVETIRLIAGLLQVPHKAFIEAKLAAKAEFSIGSGA